MGGTDEYEYMKDKAMIYEELGKVIKAGEGEGDERMAMVAKAIAAYEAAVEKVKMIAYRERLRGLDRELNEYWQAILLGREEAGATLSKYMSRVEEVGESKAGAVIITSSKRVYMGEREFKREVVARWDKDKNFEIEESRIKEWIKEKQKEGGKK